MGPSRILPVVMLGNTAIVSFLLWLTPYHAIGIRLKFLTAEDQAKFEDLFSRAAASTGGRNVPGGWCTPAPFEKRERES